MLTCVWKRYDGVYWTAGRLRACRRFRRVVPLLCRLRAPWTRRSLSSRRPRRCRAGCGWAAACSWGRSDAASLRGSRSRRRGPTSPPPERRAHGDIISQVVETFPAEITAFVSTQQKRLNQESYSPSQYLPSTLADILNFLNHFIAGNVPKTIQNISIWATHEMQWGDWLKTSWNTTHVSLHDNVRQGDIRRLHTLKEAIKQ